MAPTTRLLAAIAFLVLAPLARGQFQPPAGPPAKTPAPAPATKPAAPAAEPPAETPISADPNQKFTTTTIAVKSVEIAPSNWKPGQPIKTADDLLSALEHADVTFRSLQADLRKTKIFGEIEGSGTRVYDGRVLFVSESGSGSPSPTPGSESRGTQKPRRMFQVDFTSTTDDGVKRPDGRTFVFDGQWFVERQPDVKQIHKRQIVPPGQTVDPLAIGEGPFPIPIGQKRERILQRFTAELVPADQFPPSPDDATGAKEAKQAAEFVKDTWQLRLVPRPTAEEAQRYREVRIWYRKSDLLPRFARTTDRDDSVNVIALMKIQLNQPLPPGAFDTSIPQGWDAQIDEYRAPAAENPAPPTSPAAPAANPTPSPPKNR